MDDHPTKKLTLELERLKGMLNEARNGEASKVEGADVLVRSLETEYARVDAQLLACLGELAGDGPAGKTLAKGQSMAGVVNSAPDVSLTAMVRGIGLGDWRGIRPEVRAQISSIPAAIPGAISAGIVDLAREQSVVFRAGAQLMPIDAPSAKVARMTSEPAVQWEPESPARDLTDGAWVFDSAELTASSAWLYTTLSIEALEDCLNIDSTIKNAFAAQLGLAFDQAAIAGDGADKPVGFALMSTAEDRIIEMNAVGALVDYRPFVRAMGLVKAAHHEPSSIVMPVGIWTALANLQDTDTNPMVPPRAYGQLTEYVSSFLPTNGGAGTNESTVIVGDLSKLTFGVRTGITLEVSRDGTGFKKGAVEVRGYVRFGTYLTDPTAIAVLRGITVAA